MALTNDQITAQNFKDFYGQIRPYLNGNVPTFANTFNKSDLYSTDEQLIGRWIDGKPLYQKVINCGATPSRVCTFPHGISNLETVVLLRGIGRINERWDFLPYPTPDSITYQVRLDILKSSNIRFSYGSGADLYQEVYVIIQYTKSTDSSMSISDSNEYSTDEQVVGHWIDNKIVYQKVYEVDINSNEGGVNVTIPSVDTLIECKISYKDPRPSMGSVNYYQANTDSIRIYFENGKLNWKCGSTYPYKPIHVVAILRYTKTTD